MEKTNPDAEPVNGQHQIISVAHPTGCSCSAASRSVVRQQGLRRARPGPDRAGGPRPGRRGPGRVGHPTVRPDVGRLRPPLVNLHGHAELPGSHLVAPAGWMGCRFPEEVEDRMLGGMGPLGPLVAWPLRAAASSRPASPAPPAGGTNHQQITREATETEPRSDRDADDPPENGLQDLGRHHPHADQSSRA
jgi:hypothetical protein